MTPDTKIAYTVEEQMVNSSQEAFARQGNPDPCDQNLSTTLEFKVTAHPKAKWVVITEARMLRDHLTEYEVIGKDFFRFGVLAALATRSDVRLETVLGNRWLIRQRRERVVQ